MKIKEDIVSWALAFIAVILIYAIFTSDAQGASPHHDVPAPVTYVTEVYETYNVTETVYATDEQIAQALEAASPTTYSYTPDDCQGVAIAQAGANNVMYMGTDKPQISLGLGECGGEFASSLMGGIRLNNKLMLTGSWARDEDVDAYGVGLNMVFK